MATSGVTEYILNRNQIIEGSLRLLGQLADGESASADQIINGQTSLNRMVKAWVAQGIHLWKYEELVLFLEVGKEQYKVGGTNPDNIVEESGVNFTALAVAAVATDPTITVDDASNCLDGDFIGIILDDGTAHWTTISGAPVGNVITLTDVMPGAADIGNDVYCYTTKAERPENLVSIRRVINSITDASPQETPIRTISRDEYFAQPLKNTTGLTNEVYYDKQLGFGNFFVWPSPIDSNKQLKMTVQRPFEIFDSAEDDADFPPEWYDPLTWNLAVRMAPEFGFPLQDLQALDAKARQILDEMLMFDRENQAIYFSPNFDGSAYSGTD